jgi:hypothetical protein
LPAVLTDLTNSDRLSRNIPPLSVNPLLQKAAQMKANDMATRGYFAHKTPEGRDPWYWFEEVGYLYERAGENLAVDFGESWAVKNAWMNSPTHRANILNNRFTEIGIATQEGFYNGRRTVFVVQMFGTPKAQIPPRPVISQIDREVVAQTPKSIVGPQVAGAETSEEVPQSKVIPPQSNLIEKLITSPSRVSILMYSLIILATIISLGSLVTIEIRHRNSKHLIYGFAILVISAVFIYFEWLTIFSSVKIA